MFLESLLSHSVTNASFIMRFHCLGSLVNVEQMAMVALLNLTVIDGVYIIQLFNLSL